MSARNKMVLLLLMVCLGATSWKLFASRTRIAPEEMLLARWQYAAKTVRNVQGTINVWHYDPVWNKEAKFEGKFWYTSDHCGAYLLRPLPPQQPDDWTYLEWDAQRVKYVENHQKIIRITEIPLCVRTQVVAAVRKSSQPDSWLSEGFFRWAILLSLPSEHLPLILPREGKFWTDEFHWKPVPGLAGWLTAEPVDAEDNSKERLDLILDPKSGLPLAVQKHLPGASRERFVCVISDMKLDAKSLPGISPVTDENSRKWKIIRESLPQTAKAD